MRMENPCGSCEFKGCGSHRDTCEEYQEYSRYKRDLNHQRQKKNTINTQNSKFQMRGGSNQR